MFETNQREQLGVRAERAILAAVRLPESAYDERDPFGELASLAEQAGAIVVGTMEQRLQRPVAGTFIGKGKLEELKGACESLEADCVIFDHDLSPRQLASIEEVVGRKILDRSELILDIFAARATTHEAKLQVEIAQLEYTAPRLRAMWSHLERITGGAPTGVGARGPGEQQLEIDRRIVQRRLVELKRELAEIHERKRRMVQKRRAEHFTVGIVGYTNAGKSTLFNNLTSGGAYADDRLFATLITRTREWDLGGGLNVMLSDTVGFVRDLPHHLVASFRATLEEATGSDVLLVVLDVGDPAAELRFRAVEGTLDSLEEESAERAARERETFTAPERIILLNKVDLLPEQRGLESWLRRLPGAIPIVAREPGGPGHEELRRRVLDLARGPVRAVEISVPLSESRVIHTIENQSEVLDRAYRGEGRSAEAVLTVRIGLRLLDRLRATGSGLRSRVLEGLPEGME